MYLPVFLRKLFIILVLDGLPPLMRSSHLFESKYRRRRRGTLRRFCSVTLFKNSLRLFKSRFGEVNSSKSFILQSLSRSSAIHPWTASFCPPQQCAIKLLSMTSLTLIVFNSRQTRSMPLISFSKTAVNPSKGPPLMITVSP